MAGGRWSRIGVLATLVVTLVATGIPSASAAGSFTDDDGNPHEGFIEAIAAEGITQGCTSSRYCPADAVTRAQMAEFVVRAFDLPTGGGNPFTDIASSPHATAIVALATSGITKGCSENRFCPTAPVTRAEMASFLARAAGLPTAGTSSRFSDDDGSAHEADIEALAVAGITKGCGGSRYCPHGAVRRDEMASFLGRALGLDAVTLPSSSSGSSIQVSPGQDLAALAAAHPAGTSFVLQPGTHDVRRVNAKDGQVFRGLPGAVATGRNTAEAAFVGSARGVVIDGLVFEYYASKPSFGVIQSSGTNWTIQNSEFRYNASVGVVFQSGFKVLGNHIHHNGQLGIKGYGDGALVAGNEIAFNNHQEKYDFGWEAGASKFIRTTNLTVRDNHVHDNRGPGLWTDGFNRNTLYEGNTVENNAGPGIFHEISYDAVIRNNTVRGNAHDFYIGGILVSGSTGVEVYGNTLSGNDGGIIGLEDDRSDEGVPYQVDNLWVHDNQIAFTVGVSGLWSNNGLGLYQRNNRFDGNRYAVTSDRPFRWNNQNVSWADWRGAGQDPGGSLG